MTSSASRLVVAVTARPKAAALALYVGISSLIFGLPLLMSPGRSYVGSHDDPQIFIWSFAWLPQALLHGHNPLLTEAIWYPGGVNLTWATTVPGLALVMWPVTAVAGPIASYNLCAVTLPALAAWCAYLLGCRLVTSQWAAIIGGFLFGFSSYMLAQAPGHLHMIAVFPLPLIALVALRYLNGEIGRRGLTVAVGCLMAAELLCSTELTFTVTAALCLALVLAYVVWRDRRGELRRMVLPLVGGYALAAIISAPFLYYAMTGFRMSGFQPADHYTTDLANLLVPTRINLIGAHLPTGATSGFPGNDGERDAFLGLALLIPLSWAWRTRRASMTRFLAAFGLLAIFFSLGSSLVVFGHRVFPIPGLFGRETLNLPLAGTTHVLLFNNTLPARLMLFASLAFALMFALWTSAASRGARVVVPLLTILMLLPWPGANTWATATSVPPFFSNAAYRACLQPGENILPIPIGADSNSMLWQVAADFRFRMAGGRIATSPPSPFLHPSSIAQIAVGYPPGPDTTSLLRKYIAVEHVTTVVLAPSAARLWRPYIEPIAPGLPVGGVVVFRVNGAPVPAGCPSL